MATREEIREGIAELLFGKYDTDRGKYLWQDTPIEKRQHYLMHADDLLGYESDQGVVVKVGKELPFFIREARDWESVKQIESKLAGFVAVEPLIGD